MLFMRYTYTGTVKTKSTSVHHQITQKVDQHTNNFKFLFVSNFIYGYIIIYNIYYALTVF